MMSKLLNWEIPKTKQEIPFRHREDAEWLTIEICQEYRKRALQLQQRDSNDTGARHDLRLELEKRCDITEIQAVNILNGCHAVDYVEYYRMMRMRTPLQKADPEYLEWIQQKEEMNSSKDDGSAIGGGNYLSQWRIP